MKKDDVPVTDESGRRVGTARVFTDDDGDMGVDMTVDDETARMLTAGLIKDVSLDTTARVIATPETPGGLFAQSIWGGGKSWMFLGAGPISFAAVEAAKDAELAFTRHIQSITMTLEMSGAAIRQLRRLCISRAAGPRRHRMHWHCWQCLRSFPGRWQWRKHERTAHGHA